MHIDILKYKIEQVQSELSFINEELDSLTDEEISDRVSQAWQDLDAILAEVDDVNIDSIDSDDY